MFVYIVIMVVIIHVQFWLVWFHKISQEQKNLNVKDYKKGVTQNITEYTFFFLSLVLVSARYSFRKSEKN